MTERREIDGSSWNAALMTPRILTLAMAGSCAIYAGLVVGGLLSPGPSEGLDYLFVGMALLASVAGQLAYSFLPRPPLESPTTTQAATFSGDPERRVLTDPAHARVAFVTSEFTPHILRLGLSEVPAVLGLAGYIAVGVPVTIVLALCGLSAAIILAAFPRASAWEKAAEKRLNAVFDK